MAAATLEPIEPGKLYPLSTFQDASGLGRAALASAVRQGLVTRRIGSRKYIHGQDFIDFVREHGKTDDR